MRLRAEHRAQSCEAAGIDKGNLMACLQVRLGRRSFLCASMPRGQPSKTSLLFCEGRRRISWMDACWDSLEDSLFAGPATDHLESAFFHSLISLVQIVNARTLTPCRKAQAASTSTLSLTPRMRGVPAQLAAQPALRWTNLAIITQIDEPMNFL